MLKSFIKGAMLYLIVVMSILISNGILDFLIVLFIATMVWLISLIIHESLCNKGKYKSIHDSEFADQ